MKNKHVLLKHPFSAVVNQNIRALLEVGPAPRGGNGFTANVTGRGDNQTHGASFRFISDLQNWDYTLSPNSIAATIYDAWERVIMSEYKLLFVPEKVRSLVTPQLKMIMDNLLFGLPKKCT